jgi:hypothetical protein
MVRGLQDFGTQGGVGQRQPHPLHRLLVHVASRHEADVAMAQTKSDRMAIFKEGAAATARSLM